MMNVTMQGKPVKLIAQKAGWYTVETDDGKQKSVRRAALDIQSDGATNGVDAMRALDFSRPVNEAPTAPTAPTKENVMSVQTQTTEVKSNGSKRAKAAPKPKAAKAKKAPKAAKKGVVGSKVKPVKRAKNATGPVQAIVREAANGKQYKYKYAGKTASGNVSYDCGDEVAEKLRGKTNDEVFAIVAKAMLKKGNLKGDFAACTTADGIERKLKASLKDANPGRQRMTLGNRLRGALRAKAE